MMKKITYYGGNLKEKNVATVPKGSYSSMLYVGVGYSDGTVAGYIGTGYLYYSWNLLYSGRGYAMVRYFKLGVAGLFFRSDLSFGICSILLVVLLLFHPYGVMIFLPIAAGFFMIIGSVLDIQISVEMRRLHFGNWGIMLTLGIINIIFAFLLLMNPFQSAFVLVIFVGISLLVDSIQNFYSIYCISKAIRDSKSNQIIDVEWYSAD